MRQRSRRTLVARADNAGDVLLAGPAIRAVAASASVTVLTSPQGEPAAALLPGVDRIVVHHLPWIDAHPRALSRAAFTALVDDLAAGGYDEAAILTSSHQSSLPLALALRLAGVPRIAAVSLDYPGSLLDHRIPGDPDVHETERALAVVSALGHTLPPGDDGRLRVTLTPTPRTATVVVHPGATVEARTLAPDRWGAVSRALAAAGHRVVVTGAPSERDLVGAVVAGASAGADVVVTGVITPSLRDLALVVAEAAVVVSGNTGPMHLAAAVGTPVVVPFAPTVPLERWHPWGVPFVALGEQDIACAGCRARTCPLPGQPCLAAVDGPAVVEAVTALAADGALAPAGARAGTGAPLAQGTAR